MSKRNAGEWGISDKTPPGYAITPQRREHLNAFYIGRTPVTQSQYAHFLRETDHIVPNVETERE